MNCSYCGHTLQDNQNFCGQCGQPTDAENSASYNRPQNVAETQASGVSEEGLSLFVGKCADSYLQKWRHGSLWNWPAFLFDAHWLMYRRMYLYCVFYLIIIFVWSNMIVASLFSGWNPVESPGLLPLVVALCCIPKLVLGIVANKLYLHQAKRKITAIVQEPYEQESREKEITEAGGTNLVLPLVVLTMPYLLALLAGLFFFFKYYLIFNDALEKTTVTTMTTVTNERQVTAAQTIAPAKWEDTERINILLLGGDSRKKNELPSSDSMMVVSIDPVTKKVNLFSILRDTYVNIPGYGEESIKRAITIGGSNLAVRTAEEWAGISIQYYVYTDLQGFIALIDEIGGIDIEVEKKMKYADSHDEPVYDINLEKGFQHLDGTAALQYVRFRYDAMGDFTRTERQRYFLKEVAQKLMTATTIIELPSLLHAIEPYIETNIGVDDMVKLGTLGFEINTESIDSIQLPPMELIQDQLVNGKMVLYVREPEQLKSYVESVLEDDSGAQSN